MQKHFIIALSGKNTTWHYSGETSKYECGNKLQRSFNMEI